jgi:hypothetical protein
LLALYSLVFTGSGWPWLSQVAAGATKARDELQEKASRCICQPNEGWKDQPGRHQGARKSLKTLQPQLSCSGTYKMQRWSFLQMLADAGFLDAKVHGWTGYRASPFTQGSLITAGKPNGAASLGVKPE